MYIVGITGGIATGKSNVLNILKAARAKVWDADLVAREIVVPNNDGWNALRKIYTDDYFNLDGTLNREAMAQNVFGNQEELKKLNATLHPIILKNMHDRISKWNSEGIKLVFIDAPLLFESKIEQYCDEVWVTSCGMDEQIKRIIKRDSITAQDAVKRINSQMPDPQRRAKANRIIDTLAPKEETEKYILALLEELNDEI